MNEDSDDLTFQLVLGDLTDRPIKLSMPEIEHTITALTAGGLKWHRLDGPAVTWWCGAENWWAYGNDITDDVAEWITEASGEEHSIVDWRCWSAETWVHFRLRF